MSREQLVALTRRNIAHSVNGTVPLEDDIMRVPSSNYYDPARWQLEMDRIFRRLPLVLGFSAELREPHSYKALEVMGTPVLLMRDGDGVLRSFVNMCSHRGAQLVERRPERRADVGRARDVRRRRQDVVEEPTQPLRVRQPDRDGRRRRGGDGPGARGDADRFGRHGAMLRAPPRLRAGTRAFHASHARRSP